MGKLAEIKTKQTQASVEGFIDSNMAHQDLIIELSTINENFTARNIRCRFWSWYKTI